MQNKDISINYNSNKIKEREKRHKSAINALNIIEHNNSYSNDDYNNIYKKNNQNLNYWSDRLMTVEQMPRFKKSEINNKINEKNIKRQKFLDRINADIKDLL